MKSIHPLVWISLLMLFGWTIDVRAQSGLDRDSLRLYGGTYMSDCKNNSSPRVTVFADAVVAIQGDKRVSGANLTASHTYFGNNPPPEYLVALMSEVRGQELVAIVTRERAGQALTIDGEPLRATLGKAFTSSKFRRCDGAPAKSAQPRATPPPSQVNSPLGPTELLRDATFRSAYFASLGPHAKEDWLSRLDGPSPAPRKIRVGGAEYQVVSVCKQNDCSDNNAVLLYSATQRVVYGKLLIRRRGALIGNPPVVVASELDCLWATEWRQRR